MPSMVGQASSQQSTAKQLYELPEHLACQLSAEALDVIKQVESLAYDQAGCRMIQKMLEENFASKGKNSPFSAGLTHVIRDIMPSIMTNQFGNYLCQKLIEVSSVASFKMIVKACLPSLVEVAMDLHGTRVIQTMVETLGQDTATMHDEILMVGAEMSQYIFDLSTHSNGNHVIQAFLLTFKASDTPDQKDCPGSE